MFVKICGITDREDALAAVDAGARALGFIFYPPSPRHVTIAQIEPWINEIPAHIWRVGVFVDESPELIEQIAAQLHLDIAQLHGVETPARHPRAIRIWKAFRVSKKQTQIPDYPAEAILIDGAEYDWTHNSAQDTAHFSKPLIMAGGLNPENVRGAIARAATKPWAVDVASGVESSPGRKDHARMKQFIEAALHPVNKA
jgi:phosphoribosylanthranilate isomerase